jgi:hypothetical protein
MNTPAAVDCNGKPVEVGTFVKLLSVASFLEDDLPPDEFASLKLMVGKVFEVVEIDETGAAWIEHEFEQGIDDVATHSLALRAHEMERVEDEIDANWNPEVR